jgi:hypothetical protein
MTISAVTGKRVKTADQSHCSGLMKLLWTSGRPNIAMRLALLYKMITVPQLEEKFPPVFNSLEEFAKHHEGA